MAVRCSREGGLPAPEPRRRAIVELLGTFSLTPGQNQRVELSGWGGGIVTADAVAIESATGSPGNQAIWTLPVETPDTYDVFARWGEWDSNATDAKYTVHHANGSDTVIKNQGANYGYWHKLGTYDLAPNSGHKVVLSDRADGVVNADAIQIVSAEDVERVARWQGTVTNAGTYQVWARWPAAPTHAFAASYDIVTPGGTETVTVNQRIEGGRWHLLKTVTLAANDNWKVELSDQAPGEVVADAVAITPPLRLAGRLDWSPTLPSAGDYAVFAKWQAAPDRATDATYEIKHSTGIDLVKVDQRVNGGEWRYLGTWTFDPGQSPKVSLLASLTGTVDADAVRFVSGDAIGGEIAYSHTDQIATIQKMTDASGTLVWDRIARPFGETVSISAASGIEQKLRFPGQYADETGLSYNYFRDYDPTLGRYAQSDPIGLDGGINTYAYVSGNPLLHSDPLGLMPPPKSPPQPLPLNPLPDPPFGDDKLRGLTDEQLEELYKKLRKEGKGKDANRVRQEQKYRSASGKQKQRGQPKMRMWPWNWIMPELYCIIEPIICGGRKDEANACPPTGTDASDIIAGLWEKT